MSSGQFRVRVLPSCDISMPISGDTTSGAMEAGRGAAAIIIATITLTKIKLKITITIAITGTTY